MAFTQQIAAFEAYLANTLIREVFIDKDAIGNLLKKDKKLLEMRFDLRQIVADPKLVANQVRKYLREVIYHRLDLVNSLYRNAFGWSVLTDNPNMSRLFEAIKHRHDCVHRNGFTTDGLKLTVFTPDYIKILQNIMDEIVTKIENEITMSVAVDSLF